MGRAALEMALRQAGVDRNLLTALAADLAEGRHDHPDLDEDVEHLGAPGPSRQPRSLSETDFEAHWGPPTVVADADVCGGFGDLCGRRVA